MTTDHLAQLSATLVAVFTPMIVVGVARHVASQHAAGVGQPLKVPRASMRALTWATVAVGLTAVAAVVLMRPFSLWLAGLDLLAFAVLAVFAMKALGDIDIASRPARMLASATREASLAPRRLRDYVSLPLRVTPFILTAAGLATFVARLATPAGPRQLLVPVMFAGAAAVFLWLYEVWIRDLLSGPAVAGSPGDDEGRRRRIRRVLGIETVLTGTCLVVANVLVNVDWETDAGAGSATLFAGALVAIVGCALALASGLERRSYVNASR